MAVDTEAALFTHPELLWFEGRPVDLETVTIDRLIESSELIDQPSRLRDRFESDGYLYVSGLMDPELVLAARRELLLKYATLGEIDDRSPVEHGIAGDQGGLMTANLRAFSESLRTGAAYEAVILHQNLIDVVRSALDGPVRPYDFRWPRLARPGEGCGLHCDGPYMSRGTDRHLSVWIPFGSIEPHEGGLMLLEESVHSTKLRDGYLKMDADRDGLVWLDDNLAAVQQEYGSRWLTTHYQPGDVLIFSMKMLHGALENRSPENRCRLSTDSRYLVDGEVPDPRWNGDDLNPHGPGRVFYPGLGKWQ
ncbi:MAG: phytanoyl-CoA dioxygenase family protein, partial [Actinomycetota bacterium]